MTDGIRQGSRVQQWVREIETEGNDLHKSLAANFTYYLEHVDELESGTLSFNDLPEFEGADKAVMHAAVMFGLSWAKDSSIHVVTGEDDQYITTLGRSDNAETITDLDTDDFDGDISVTTTTPIGKDPQEDIEDMKAGNSELLPKVGECLEYLLEHEQAFEKGASEGIIDGMPHFSENVKWLIAFSALFGRLWEFSDPALWVLLGPNGTFEGIYADPTLAAEAQTELDGATVDSITPFDNDRQSATEISLE